ncbi:hypothetical protein ABPG77_005981 [Micractinium sp. CCAP 211/92]
MCCSSVYVQPAPAAAKAQQPPAQVTAADVQQVHAAIEHCLSRHMTKLEAVQLLARLGVAPKFSLLVWERLEAENPEFFQAYYQQLEATAEFERFRL